MLAEAEAEMIDALSGFKLFIDILRKKPNLPPKREVLASAGTIDSRLLAKLVRRPCDGPMLTEVAMGGEAAVLTLEEDPVPEARRLSRDPADRIFRTVRPANDGCGRASSSSVSLDARDASS
jgi:hypothetical protein